MNHDTTRYLFPDLFSPSHTDHIANLERALSKCHDERQKWEDRCIRNSECWKAAVRTQDEQRLEILDLRLRVMQFKECAEDFWVLTASVSEGNWDKQSEIWRAAADIRRDRLHELCKKYDFRCA